MALVRAMTVEPGGRSRQPGKMSPIQQTSSAASLYAGSWWGLEREPDDIKAVIDLRA